MPKFFAPNIDRTGRILRAGWGILMLAGGIPAWRWHWWAGVLLMAFALLAFYEALRGWCIVRACGIKTRY